LTDACCGDIILFLKQHVSFEKDSLLSILRINAPRFGCGLKFERNADHHQRRENELLDLLCGIDDGKVVPTFMINDQYVYINSMEDLVTTKSLVKE
jgi:hypothetical protein